MEARERANSIIPNFFPSGGELLSIPNPAPDWDSHQYQASEFEGFQYVFHQDNMPTYHQQYDNFLHWRWNEYHNDPKWESQQYKLSVLDKVFNYVNARILGVLNPSPNHAEILQFLNKLCPEMDFFEYVLTKRNQLRGRKDPFTKQDAIVWYVVNEIPYDIRGYHQNPMVIPYIQFDDHKITRTINDIRTFYHMIFQYTILFYKHVMADKFHPTWDPLDPDDYLFCTQSGRHADQMGETDYLTVPSDDRVPFIQSEFTLEKASNLPIQEGSRELYYVFSDNGNYFDNWMKPYTMTLIAKKDNQLYISTQNGYTKFRMENDQISSQEFMWNRFHNSKGEEGTATEMWRDIMESNGILFPVNAIVSIALRITNWDKYRHDICLCLGTSDRLQSSSQPNENIAFLSIHEVPPLLKIWEIMEHTLDLWVKYDTEGSSGWSLISNIHQHDFTFYADNPHIPYIPCDSRNIFGPVVCIIPRDGMCWSTQQGDFHYTQKAINGEKVRNIYI